MLIALGSIKGSPGVTTFALALAARWPGASRPVLVECDPAGGDIAARFGLTGSPGLMSLAAAARHANDSELIWQHTQTLRGGLSVVAGALRPDQAATALRTLSDAEGGGVLAAAASRAEVVVLADCGRLAPESLPVITAADQLLLLVRPLRDELAHLAARLPELSRCARRVGLLLAGPGYSQVEVAAELGVPVLAWVPSDAWTASLLCGKPVRASLSRRRLPRAADDVANAVAAALGNGRAADDMASTFDGGAPAESREPAMLGSANGSRR